MPVSLEATRTARALIEADLAAIEAGFTMLDTLGFQLSRHAIGLPDGVPDRLRYSGQALADALRGVADRMERVFAEPSVVVQFRQAAE